MSLADELLADLEDGEEDVEPETNEQEEDEEIDEVMDTAPISGYDRVTDVAKLMSSQK